jgi:hypothetical protein
MAEWGMMQTKSHPQPGANGERVEQRSPNGVEKAQPRRHAQD